MEARRIDSFSLDEQKELKKFHTSFTLFLIAEIFLVVSSIANATNINGVPQVLSLLLILANVANFLFLIALIFIYKLNKSFTYSLIALIIFLVLAYIVTLCASSINPSDNAFGKGFSWSASISQVIFFIYYFHGCKILFEKFNLSRGPKQFRIFIIVFATLFLLEETFEYFSTAKFILSNHFANRFFLYGYWALSFFTNLFVLIAVLLTKRYIDKQIIFKEKKRKDKKVNEQI